MLLKMFEEYRNGTISRFELEVKLAQFDEMYEHAKFLCTMGTPTKSSKDFQRNQSKVIDSIAYCVAAVEHDGEVVIVVPNTLYDKQEAMETARKVAIQYPWLNGDL